MTQDMTQGKIMPMLVHFTIPLVLGSSWLIKGNKKKGKANPDGISGRLQE